jgi:antitoxin component of RelBE/YafQ-DinJ toxin-antitoxin module
MSKTAMIRARIEPDLKTEAEQVLAQVGLTPMEAIRLSQSTERVVFKAT